MTEERISSIMREDFVSLSPTTPIREAIAALVKDNTSAAPVVDDTGRMIGILTQKDCFRPSLNASYYQEWKGSVAEHLTEKVETLDASQDFVTAAEMFLDRPHRSFPVTRNGDLVGMLDRSDLLRAFLRHG